MDTSNTYSTLYEKLRSSLAEAVDASYQLTNTDVAARRKELAATKQALLAEITQLNAPEDDRAAEDSDDDTSDDEILTKREWNVQMEKLLQERLKMEVNMESERAQLSIIGAQCAKQLQWSQGIKSHSFVARDLNILFAERPECWKWTSVPETIYAVAELLDAESIDISCRINTSKLIPGIEYTAYLVFMMKPNGDDTNENEDEKLLASLPYADAYIEAIGKEKRVIKVSLAAKPFPNYEENGDDTNREEADRYAESYEYDGWRGVELGDYTVKDDDEDEEVEVEIGLKESSGLIKELIVQGIVVKNRFM